MKKIILFLILLFAVQTQAQKEWWLWKLSGTRLTPIVSTWGIDLGETIINAQNSAVPLLVNGNAKGSYHFQIDASDGSTWGFSINSGDNFEIRKVGVGLGITIIANGGVTANGYLKADGTIGNVAQQAITLGAGATTFAVTSNVVTVTGDVGANTIATITGAGTGTYTFIFVDALITITDNDSHGANSIDLAGTATNFTSADDKTLTLVYDGTSFYQIGVSTN